VASQAVFATELVLEEVIVTAQKRAEPAQHIAIAIDALDADAIAQLRVNDSDRLLALFPNLGSKASSSINSGFSIRGVGTANFHVTAQNAVGAYLDEVSLPTPFTSQQALFDLERIEVLRGPQNTLFGRNTTGGAVNMSSIKPVFDAPDNYLQIAGGTANARAVDAGIGGVLSESLAYRIALHSKNRDGVFVDLSERKDTGRIERHAGRAQLLWRPNADQQLLLRLHGSYDRSDRGPRKALGLWQQGSANTGNYAAADCPQINSFASTRFEGLNNCVTVVNGTEVNPSTNSWNEVYDAANTAADIDFEGVSLRYHVDFAAMQLLSITSRDSVSVNFQENTTAIGRPVFYPGQQADYSVFSQELRLSSQDDSTLRWMTGVYYAYHDDELATIIRNATNGTPPFTVVPAVIVEQRVEIASAYGQLQWDATDRLGVTLGLRYTSDRKRGDSTSIVIAGTNNGLPGRPAPSDQLYSINDINTLAGNTPGSCPPAIGGLPCKLGPINVQQKLSEWGGRASLDWQVQDNLLAYLSFSRGFKSGAFDTRALAIFAGNANKPVGPEFLNAWETGIKSEWLNQRLRINGALFLYDWRDLQVFATAADGSPAFLNVPRSKLSGAEFSVDWAAGNNWRLGLDLGWLDSEITDDGGLKSARNGADIAAAPEFTANTSIEKLFNFENSSLTLTLLARYRGAFNSGFTNSPRMNLAAQTHVDAQARWQFNDLQLSLDVENITREKSCSIIGDEGALTNVVTCLAQPDNRIITIGMRLDF
jgi:iron complex outermembrane receptor protein